MNNIKNFMQYESSSYSIQVLNNRNLTDFNNVSMKNIVRMLEDIDYAIIGEYLINKYSHILRNTKTNSDDSLHIFYGTMFIQTIKEKILNKIFYEPIAHNNHMNKLCYAFKVYGNLFTIYANNSSSNILCEDHLNPNEICNCIKALIDKIIITDESYIIDFLKSSSNLYNNLFF